MLASVGRAMIENLADEINDNYCEDHAHTLSAEECTKQAAVENALRGLLKEFSEKNSVILRYIDGQSSSPCTE